MTRNTTALIRIDVHQTVDGKREDFLTEIIVTRKLLAAFLQHVANKEYVERNENEPLENPFTITFSPAPEGSELDEDLVAWEDEGYDSMEEAFLSLLDAAW